MCITVYMCIAVYSTCIIARDSQKQPGATKRKQGLSMGINQGHPGTTRDNQRQPGTTRGNQEQPGTTRGSQQHRGNQGQPEAPSGNQGQPIEKTCASKPANQRTSSTKGGWRQGRSLNMFMCIPVSTRIALTRCMEKYPLHTYIYIYIFTFDYIYTYIYIYIDMLSYTLIL